MLSKKVMSVAELAEFANWLKLHKGFDADLLLQDPDGFEDEYDEFLHGPEPCGPYVRGHCGVRDTATGMIVDH